jgi:hypothetical protein
MPLDGMPALLHTASVVSDPINGSVTRSLEVMPSRMKHVFRELRGISQDKVIPVMKWEVVCGRGFAILIVHNRLGTILSVQAITDFAGSTSWGVECEGHVIETPLINVTQVRHITTKSSNLRGFYRFTRRDFFVTPQLAGQALLSNSG